MVAAGGGVDGGSAKHERSIGSHLVGLGTPNIGPGRSVEYDRLLFSISGRKNVGCSAAGFVAGPADGNDMGWLMGLEPTTTGITILDSTN